MKQNKFHHKAREFYQALMNRDSTYDGIFFVGISSTGIFCRPTCSARKPKFENCEFFSTAQECLLAGYRACRRCHPFQMPGEPSPLIRDLIALVENDLSRRWRDTDLRTLGIDPSTARRQFNKRFGMTFVAFARSRRLGLGLKTIREGEPVIHAQLESGYESGSGFRDAFSRLMGNPPNREEHRVLKAEWFESPLGSMIALADDDQLHLLEFTDRRGLETEIINIRKRHKYAIIPGNTPVLDQIRAELTAYFEGTLHQFETPLNLYGSEFQRSVMNLLLQVPYGETRSYAEQAKKLGRPEAIRAVANANGKNQLAIVVPCHRIIGSDGNLTGYGGGLARKEWLINHEKKHS